MNNKTKIFRYLPLVLIPIILSCSIACGATVRYALSNWPPMGYVEQGELKGVFAEILKAVFERELQLTVSPDQKPWKRAQRQVELGNADLMITPLTDERLKYAVASDLPFFNMYLYAFTTAGHPKLQIIRGVKSVQDLIDHDLRAVTNRGNGWHAVNVQGKGVKTQLVTDEIDALMFLKHKRADVMIDALIATNLIIKKQKLEGSIIPTRAKFGPIKFYLMVSKKSVYAPLMPKINKAFKKLKKSGVIDQIISRYEKM